jgi:Icc-related predicted phosphoesterase
MNQSLKIDCISDTHGQHRKINLPGGDIIIHSGDCCCGRLEAAMEFLDWYKEQKYSHLILVPGNHDSIFERMPELMLEECKNRGIILLNDSGCEIEGIKIWGSPVQPWFYDWAFNRQRGADIQRHWDLIPKDTEILITHGPPYKIRDEVKSDGLSIYVGCEDLYRTILQTQIKLHIFGHVHEGRGHAYLDSRTYINASSVDVGYNFIDPGYVRVSKQDGSYVVRESKII